MMLLWIAAFGGGSLALDPRHPDTCTFGEYRDFPHCYADSVDSPILPVLIDWLPYQEVDLDTCVHACFTYNHNFSIAGLGGGELAYCLCGNEATADFPSATSAGCNVTCPRAKNELCGGAGMFVSIYAFHCDPGELPYYGSSGSLGLFDIVGLLLLCALVVGTVVVVAGTIVNRKVYALDGVDGVPGGRYAVSSWDILTSGVGWVGEVVGNGVARLRPGSKTGAGESSAARTHTSWPVASTATPVPADAEHSL